MKIKITEIEATAEELKASEPLSSAFTNVLRRAFVGAGTSYVCTNNHETEADDEQMESEDK